MKELELLDLQKCHSVADIVSAMSRCSFGARMLGEVTVKISEWIIKKELPIAIYDGKLDTPLGNLLTEMVNRNWFAKLVSPQEYAANSYTFKKAIVIGNFSERYEDDLYQKPEEAIYINNYGIAKPGQITDGYYPNVVFSDPKYIIPIIFICLEEILNQKTTNISQFIDFISIYGGLASEVSHGAKTFLTMVQNPDCSVYLTLSGAMTIAKMGLIICDLIDNKMVQAICSTGALMAHGLIESVGLKHFKYNPNDDDAYLAEHKLNRVTDTLEPETNFDQIDLIMGDILNNYNEKEVLSPRLFLHKIGEYLTQHYAGERGILKSAYEHNVPVFVPAFVDSEIGNDVYVHNSSLKNKQRSPLFFNIELDTEFLVNLLIPKQLVFLLLVVVYLEIICKM